MHRYFPLLFLILLPSALGIGLSPARIEIPYQPGANLTYDFMVLNNLKTPLLVELYTTGELSKQIVIHGPLKFELDPGMVRKLSFSIFMPEGLEPGLHKSGIGAIEGIPETEGGGTQLAARAAVVMQVWVRVPYPGKYIEISLHAEDVELGEETPLRITIKNLGSEDILAEDEINIFENEEKLATVSAGKAQVKARETAELKASWKADHAGTYRAEALVKYDGSEATASATFRVGTLDLEIINLSRERVSPGEIAKFKLKLKSLWNQPIQAIHADLEIVKEDKTLKSASSAPFDLGVWEEKEIPIFLETAGLEEGNYDARVKVYFENRTKERFFENRLEIVKYKPPEISLSILAIVLLIALVFIFILAFLFGKPRKRKKHVKKKKRKRKA